MTLPRAAMHNCYAFAHEHVCIYTYVLWCIRAAHKANVAPCRNGVVACHLNITSHQAQITNTSHWLGTVAACVCILVALAVLSFLGAPRAKNGYCLLALRS